MSRHERRRPGAWFYLGIRFSFVNRGFFRGIESARVVIAGRDCGSSAGMAAVLHSLEHFLVVI